MWARSVAALQLATTEVVTVTPDTPLSECAWRMRSEHVGSLIVVEDDPTQHGVQRPVGIVTDRDIVVGAVAPGLDTHELTAGDIMVSPIATVGDEADVLEALGRMHEHGVRRLPIVDQSGRLVGILTIDNLLDLFRELFDAAVSALKSQQTRESHTRR